MKTKLLEDIISSLEATEDLAQMYWEIHKTDSEGTWEKIRASLLCKNIRNIIDGVNTIIYQLKEKEEKC
jgi:hypothetical protein